MQTESPTFIDEPAIPLQYRGSIEDAHTFALKAHRGACANLARCLKAGVSADHEAQAREHVFSTMALLANLQTPTNPRLRWSYNAATGEHEAFIDGNLEVARPRRDAAEIEVNKWFEWERTVARKNAQLITPAALAATIADDDEPIDIDAEYELMNAGEKKPVKEPYVKNAWDKANAHFRAEAAFIAPGKETPFTRSKRLEQLTRFVGRPITSTRDMTPDELTRAAFAIHDNQLSWAYERAAEKAA